MKKSKPDEPEFMPFALPLIGEEEIAEVVDSLRSGWITTGPKTARFEAAFSAATGARHALAVNSCTAGLHLALEACGVGPGDHVITTPYTFTATAEVIRYLGADPLFADIDPGSLNITPDTVSDAIASAARSGKRVAAVLPVHIAGLACDMASICTIARDAGAAVVEDAAHAFPATSNGVTIGNISDATVFSFYATKTITTGEGGMVTTNSDQIAERIRVMRLHGIDREVWNRYTSGKPNWRYEVVAPGYKYNMSDLAAAIGIHQLRKAEQFRLRRESIANSYRAAFGELPLLLPEPGPDGDTHAWHLYIIRLKPDHATINRDDFISRMLDQGIGTSVHFIPLHIQPYWRDRYGFAPEDFPNALAAFKSSVSLPIYPGMTDNDIERVINAVKSILEDR